ncbi:MAG: hypothetical protein R3A44_42460 [Caldilineaceae bacterium]
MYQSNWTRQFILIGAVLLGFLAFTLFTNQTVRAEERAVCPDGAEFATIQAAIDAATAGDTITLCAATYLEPIRIDKDLILRGAGQRATIIGAQTVTSVVSLAPDTTLTLADLSLAQGSNSVVGAATVGPYTDTLTITNTLNLTGGDQVTTIINGNVAGMLSLSRPIPKSMWSTSTSHSRPRRRRSLPPWPRRMWRRVPLMAHVSEFRVR